MKRSQRSWVCAACLIAVIAAWLGSRPSQAPGEARARVATSPHVTHVTGGPSTDAPSAPRPPRVESLDGAPDTDGLDAASFIARLAPQARRGDVVAAMRLYRVEAFCGVVERNAASLVTQTAEAQRTAEAASWGPATAQSVTAGRAFCTGVTPAQVRERLVFLDAGVRAGLPEALIEYRRAGPDGMDVASLDPADPRLIAWERNANAYLRMLADQGDYLAWSMLSLDYQRGLVVPQDFRSAILYQAAMSAARDPEADPLALDVVAAMAKQLPPDDVRSAIDEGTALGRRFADARKRS